MISSAVVIPEQPSVQEEPASPSLKRRQSSQSTEANKRPRLDSTNGSANHGSPPPSAAMSPPRRKSSLLSGTEEKKRGQRLFGALLGTLSQTSSKPAHYRRDEIEKRQQERLRRDNEEREEERKRKKEELDRSRRKEQKLWDRETTQIRHRNMRAMANFLRTKTEPRLYYKPWELRPEEEEQIKKQVEEVEGAIRKEQSDDSGQTTDVVDANAPKQDIKEEPSTTSEDASMQNGDGPREDAVKKEPEDADVEDEGTKANGEGELSDENPTSAPEVAAKSPAEDKEDKSKDDDHRGEELVEGHEDDVIY
jgi:pinin/SDK/memA/ protein conserved region